MTFSSAPTGIRTPVLALKGLRPSPLDDEGKSERDCNKPQGGKQEQFAVGRVRIR